LNLQSSFVPLLILADDLTGAADCAARCHQAGLPGTISLEPPTPPLPQGALAFTSDSRHLGPEAAAQRVRQAVAGLRDLPAHWYKKIDSTLRGHLGPELDALLESLDRPCAVICPAFPGQGRGLRAGYLVAPGVPDRSLHLPTLLRRQSQRRVAFAPQSPHLAQDLAAARKQGAEFLVVDGLSRNHLARILDGVETALPQALLCGSAGLVGVWAERLAERRGPGSGQEQARPSELPRPVLAVVGSGSAVAHQQMARLAESGLGVDRLQVEGQVAEEAAGATAEAVAAQLDPAQEIWLLHLPPPPDGTRLDGPQARRLAQALARAGMAAMAVRWPATLLLVGGDTATALLRELGVARLEVLAELEPGMPLCRGEDGQGRSLQVLLKAGSHGQAETLVRLLGGSQG